MNICGLVCAGAILMTSVSVAKTPAKKNAVPKVSSAALIAAAKSAMLSEINYGRELCDADRPVEAWLSDVVGDTAASVTWRGGSCKLVSDLNPLDAGSALVRRRDDRAERAIRRSRPRSRSFSRNPSAANRASRTRSAPSTTMTMGPSTDGFSSSSIMRIGNGTVEGFESPETRDCD